LVVEVAFEEPFLPWNHNHRDQADSRNERYQRPESVQPNGQSEYEKNESQIDGIATEPVGTGSHDHRGTLAPLDGSASSAKFPVGKQEEHYGASRNKGPEQPTTGWREMEWPGSVQDDPQQNRAQEDDRWAK
jgi:hypothetical protein